MSFLRAVLRSCLPPPTGGTGAYETLIDGLMPAIYLKLNEASGATVADSSGNGRSGTITGTPAGYNVPSLPTTIGSGNGGLNLGNLASISIPHAIADAALTMPANWQDELSTNGYRFIADTTVSIWFKINAMPAAGIKGVIFAKSNDESPGTARSYTSVHPIAATGTITGGSFEAYFYADGSVYVDVRSFRGRLCRIRTPNGALAINTAYQLVVRLSYDGVTAWLNGAQFEDGYANPQHVFGLCANIRGLLHINNFAWTIGKAAWGGQADLVVDEFAVFHRAPSATISQANVDGLAEKTSTSAPLEHAIWGRRYVNRSSYSSIQAAIDDLANDAPVPGGTVLINPGTYNESPILKSNVRLKRNGAGTVRINGRISTLMNRRQNLGIGIGTVSIGDRTITVNNTRRPDDVVVVRGLTNGVGGAATAMRFDRRWNTAAESNDPAISDGEAFIVEDVTPATMTVRGSGSTFAYGQAQRKEIIAFTPTKWVALEGLTVVKSGTSGTADKPIMINQATNVRIVDCHGKADGHSSFDVHNYSVQVSLINCKISNPFTGGVAVGGTGQIYARACADLVVIGTRVIAPGAARSWHDQGGNANFIPAMRPEAHGTIDEVGKVGSAVDGENKFGVHGSACMGVYWNLETRHGGFSPTGWKMDFRWLNLGTVSGRANIGATDGAEGTYIRDSRHRSPTEWWRAWEGSVGYVRCRFENVTSTPAPIGTMHNVRYEAVTYRNVTSPGPGWTLI